MQVERLEGQDALYMLDLANKADHMFHTVAMRLSAVTYAMLACVIVILCQDWLVWKWYCNSHGPNNPSSFPEQQPKCCRVKSWSESEWSKSNLRYSDHNIKTENSGQKKRKVYTYHVHGSLGAEATQDWLLLDQQSAESWPTEEEPFENVPWMSEHQNLTKLLHTRLERREKRCSVSLCKQIHCLYSQKLCMTTCNWTQLCLHWH